MPPPIPGIGLLQAMRRYKTDGETLGVIVIDESNNQGNRYRDQRDVLQSARALGLPVILIDINPALGRDPRAFAVRGALQFTAYADVVVNKPFLNAFDPGSHPYLPAVLTRHGLAPHSGCRLLFMGYHVNQCVRLSAVGGPDRPNGAHKDGATGWGYIVMTCPDVLGGGLATWRNDLDVEYYLRLR